MFQGRVSNSSPVPKTSRDTFSFCARSWRLTVNLLLHWKLLELFPFQATFQLFLVPVHCSTICRNSSSTFICNWVFL